MLWLNCQVNARLERQPVIVTVALALSATRGGPEAHLCPGIGVCGPLPIFSAVFSPLAAGDMVLAFIISTLACLGLPGWICYVVSCVDLKLLFVLMFSPAQGWGLAKLPVSLFRDRATAEDIRA